ncbi:MAG: hypothetical protein EOO39_15590, partial [Cytophagaceae bacterium]
VNKDGLQDAGDLPIEDAVVTLLQSGTVVATTLTDAGGLYSFTGLTPGIPYSVSFTTPVGFSAATTSNVGTNDAADSDPVGGVTAPVTLTAGENNTTLDAGFVKAELAPASLGNFVFEDVNKDGLQDAGDVPIPGAVVTLLSNGAAVATTTTDANGLYSFTGLTPGIPYSVSFTTPPGFSESTSALVGSNNAIDSDPVDGVTDPVTLTAGENNTTLDAGFIKAPASLGDFVFEDVNKDGLQDAGDLPIAGAVVTLLQSGTVVATTTTDATGLYSFTGLTPGIPYSVSFTTPPGFLSSTSANVGGDDELDSDPVGGVTAPVTLTIGEHNPTLDAGFVKAPASLGNYVFEDINQNGLQDAGDVPIAGAVVTLLQNGSPVATTTTDASGLYSFTGLTPSIPYSVSFTTPPGFSGSTTPVVGSDNTIDSDPVAGITAPVTLSSGENNTTLDAGFIKAPASLGDFVFEDVNKDGLQDPDDLPIEGAVVTLLQSGTVVATTTTDATGQYSFTGLTPGIPYSVSFTTPAGFSASTGSNVGSDDELDSDPVGGVTAPVTLTVGENNTTLDAGFVKAPTLLASLGNFVFEDVNKDGLQDAGDVPIPGAVVTLLQSGTVAGTTTTDANGLYSFTGLTPGIPYSVSFTTPVGFSTTTTDNVGTNDAIDSDPVGGVTAPVTLTAGENNPTLDAGFVKAPTLLASLGNFVFEDVNKDGLQDAGDVPIPGAVVTLLQSGTVAGTTTTDANGLYSFTGLTPGIPYSVSFTTPVGFSTTTSSNVGTNDAIDSDPVAGVTAPVTLTAGENNPTLDAGFVKAPTLLASLGNFVFEDVNKDGLQDAGDVPIPGAVVTLLQSGTVAGTTTTDANGLYSFTGLTPGIPYS